ncbi:MNIO family bufferin maturase [Bdellovibrio svalbardensis]|uniref:DUF692 domain-containing protein n=1 Tax=Bdellovibrio svalbardensis TaxID=2972972 RepID=A0ABT6DFR3_9BACT|nr:DUF692 domain-containing protein [Bdellovibrio svalbardensis]MDG0815638.1 DUF692 domain-containing protein [Bdellovibrio svalbardensis]
MRSQFHSHKVGLGLRPPHYPYLETSPTTEVAWFEAVSENYMDSRGRPLEMLTALRKDYPLALHGVGMNIGSASGVRIEYLNKLRDLIDRVEPFIVSDHICWTATSHQNMHDLLPLPYTQESLECLIENIDFVQNYLRTPLVLENVSTYLSFRANEMTEWEFVAEVSKRSGCGLLLDINNVYVNSYNHGYDPRTYLNAIPLERVAQIHLAGPTDKGTHLFDTHAEDIPDAVWSLFKTLAPKIRHIPVCIERDDNIPDFRELEAEILKAASILEKSNETARSPIFV